MREYEALSLDSVRNERVLHVILYASEHSGRTERDSVRPPDDRGKESPGE